MTTDTNNKTDNNSDNNIPNNDTPKADNITLEEALAKIEHLTNINKEVIESRDKVKSKLKSYEDEKAEEEQKLLEEQGKYKELADREKQRADQLEHAYRTTVVDGVLEKELAKVGLAAEAIGTAKALLNRDDIGFNNGSVDEQSVADAIDKLKQNHGVLFNVKVKTPDVKRPNEDKSGSYEEELKRIQQNPHSPTARRDLAALRAKYGKG